MTQKNDSDKYKYLDERKVHSLKKELNISDYMLLIFGIKPYATYLIIWCYRHIEQIIVIEWNQDSSLKKIWAVRSISKKNTLENSDPTG